MKKKTLVVTILLIVCLIACTACGKPRITGIKSLAAANIAAQAKVDNYHVDGTVNTVISLDSGELYDLLKSVDPKLPVNMTMDADAGTDSAHIVSDAEVRLFGESVGVQHAETYMDMANGDSYTKAGESQEWEKSSYQGEKEEIGFKELVGGIAAVGKTVLENAVYAETDEYYSLTLPAEKAGDLVKDLNLLDSVDLGIADVRDIKVAGGDIVYNVDKETLLVDSVEMKDVDVRGKGTYEDISIDLKFPINAKFSFSRYNELKESEYAIPAEVTGIDPTNK